MGSSSAEYYRKNAAARGKKASTDKKINAKPKQIKKRVESNAARRKAKASGKNVNGKDFHHGTGTFISSSKNRGMKSGTAGDRNARGGKKKK